MKTEPLRAIVYGFEIGLFQEIINQTIQEGYFDYCERIIYKSTPALEPSPKIHYNYIDHLIFGQYPMVNFNEILPLDVTIINAMQDCEQIVLKMMDRHESFPGMLSYSMRKDIYYNHLRYWNHIIESQKINFFITSNIPHETYDFIIYCLCKLKNIRTIHYHQAPIPDFFFRMTNYQDFMIEIRDNYKKIKDSYDRGDRTMESLSPKLKAYYEAQSSTQIDPVPFYMQSTISIENTSSHNSISETIKGIKNKIKIIIKKILYSKFPFLKTNEQINFVEVFDKNSVEPDLSKPYVYFALHFQPELTTSPLAGIFVDQYLVAEMISYHLPKGVSLYIKEHPNQLSVGRFSGFYERLLKLPNVVFIKKNFSSFRLVEYSKAVVTCTGTVGWEALFKEKPVLLFGDFFYKYATGVYRIYSNEDCKNAIFEILHEKKVPTKNDIKLYLQAMHVSLLAGYIDPAYKVISTYSEEQVKSMVYNQLIKDLTI